MAANLVWFARAKRFRPIRTIQLVLMLALPFALQWSLGGLANGSAVAGWAGITPVLAYLFGARSNAWLVAFLALLAGSGMMETTLAADAPHIDSRVRVTLFVMNLAGPSIAAFVALGYFTGSATGPAPRWPTSTACSRWSRRGPSACCSTSSPPRSPRGRARHGPCHA